MELFCHLKVFRLRLVGLGLLGLGVALVFLRRAAECNRTSDSRRVGTAYKQI